MNIKFYFVCIYETNRLGWNMLVFLHLNYILKLKENTPNIGKKKFCLSEEEHESHMSKYTSFEVKKE